eukprot:CAMPEP_0114408910 /NCGR_PEP_ID=MMETSP0102-20121206/23042_1 /TAXON_ID=38822 ORGANISM="Pteridomonas danica, Strain PT" /NCGR_SAMPLE_ID=MMETSP0102 /ASSEMBLY_ACC=CAM_ASM_000212 /LENGTH=41 /DNA_ID= /DNA_START= /DNA_END= /DNA_ORIENTATION=
MIRSAHLNMNQNLEELKTSAQFQALIPTQQFEASIPQHDSV